VRHASFRLSATATASHPHINTSLTIRRSGSGQQQLPSHSFPHTPFETPLRHALRPRPTRATTAAAHNRKPPAPSRKVCLKPIQSIPRLPCLLPAVSRPARPGLPHRRPSAHISPIYPLPVRRSAATCTFVPVYRGHLLSGGLLLEELRDQSLARIYRKRDRIAQFCKRS